MNLGRYLSDKPVWVTPTPEIRALDNKSLLIIQGDNLSEVELTIEGSPASSVEGGKVSVVGWNVMVSDEPWKEVTLIPKKAAKISDAHYWQQYVTQDALDSIRLHNSRLLGNVDFELVIPDEAATHSSSQGN
jgi:hypothetical protein